MLISKKLTYTWSSEFVRGGNLFDRDSTESEHDGIDAQLRVIMSACFKNHQ